MTSIVRAVSPPQQRTFRSKGLKKRPPSFYSQISNTRNAGLKCQFCLECFDLDDIFEHESGLSTYGTVSVSNDRTFRRWATLGRTPVVRNDLNPKYHEKEFEINELVDDGGCVLIQICALHPANDMPICIGTTQVSIKEMFNGETTIKPLRVGPYERGTIVIFMKAKKEPKGIEDIAEYCSIAEMNDSLQMSFNEQDFKNTYFKDILGDIDRQRYHINLRPQYQRSLRICEESYELATSFNIPALFIRLLTEQEHSNMLILQGMVEGFSDEVSSITAASRASKISQYREELSQLGQCSKNSFKRSDMKGQGECKWAPVNLHAQVLEVNAVCAGSKESLSRDQYCLLTVGAMAAHWDKFKNGGLLSILGKTKTGEKFVKWRELYVALDKLGDIIKELDNEELSMEIGTKLVHDLLSLSKEAVTREALQDLQNKLDPEKQLEIVNLSANLDKIVQNQPAPSIKDVCIPYSTHFQRAVVWYIAMLEMDNREHFLNILNRFEACFSQVLAAAVSGLIVNLCFQLNNKIFEQQLKEGVVPLMFEGLLSTHGDEVGMLEDMQVVMDYADAISVQLQGTSDSDQVTVSRITGTPFNVQVILSVPEEVMTLLPGGTAEKIRFVPLFFNHGINEQQTIAYKLNETAQQEKICEKFLANLQSYIEDHVTPNIHLFNSEVENGLVTDMAKLHALFKETKRAKCPEFIMLAEQIGRDLQCIRFTSCKSAKDRTSMSITYEYCNILCRQHDFQPEDVPPILEQFRRDGTRYHNTFKNIGSYKYCFNRLQCKMLPTIYRPPPGTWGDGAQQT